MSKDLLDRYLQDVFACVQGIEPQEEPIQVKEMREKHIREREALIETQKKEFKESCMEPHQQEGWLKDYIMCNATIQCKDAILSLQKQVDEIKEELEELEEEDYE